MLYADDACIVSRSPQGLAKMMEVVKLAPSRLMGKMVLDGGGHFNPAGIFGLHTLSLLLSSQAAHDRLAVDFQTHNVTHDKSKSGYSNLS